MNRRGFLSLLTRAAAATPFAAMLPKWYGTAAQWALHAREGVLRLAAAGRLTEIPGGALSPLGGPGPNTFVKYQAYARHIGGPAGRWIGHWQTTQGRVLGWVDVTGRAWWAKP